MGQPEIARRIAQPVQPAGGSTGTAPAPATGRTGRLATLVDSPRFEASIAVVIGINALVLALGTYPGVRAQYDELLEAVNAACYAVFVAELILRIASYGRRPWRFFHSGWNIFDFVVVGIALVPAFRANATLLRLARVLRIVRILKFLPDAQLLLRAISKSVGPLLTFASLMLLLLFIYAMLGWALFSTALPEHWGDLTASMRTMFILLTLENFPLYVEEALPVRPLSWIFFLSFAVIATFIVLNVIIGIVLNSLDEARAEQRAHDGETAEDATVALMARIDQLTAEIRSLRQTMPVPVSPDSVPGRDN